MNPDYYAVLGCKDYQRGFEGINYHDIDAVTTRYHVLVATGHKDDKDTGGNALRSKWASKRLKVDLGQLPDFLKPPLIDPSQLPFGSFYIQFRFKLLKPYISRDDNQFYIVDNPIVREKVFRMPMVRPTAWKGSLRHALWQLEHQEEDAQIKRLFGTANDEQPEEGNSGRLYFYPSFFTQTSLEVINPHDRERRVGKNPILIESVPPGAAATFTLLYAPLDRAGKNTCWQSLADLQLTAEGLQAMFTVYGFGAKTSSGYGVANITREGHFNINYPDKVDRPAKPASPAEPDSIRQIRAINPNENFSLKPKAWRKKHSATNNERTLYTNARADWNEYQKQLETYTQQLAVWKNVQKAPPADITKRSFTSFEGLCATIQALRTNWQKQEGDA